MTIHTKTTIKSYFETGDKPTQPQFGDLIDSYQDASDGLNYISTAAATAAAGRFLVTNGAGSYVLVSADKVKYDGGVLNIGAPLVVSGAASFGDVAASALSAASANITGRVTVGGDVAVSGNVSVSGALTAGRVGDYHSIYVETLANTTYDWVKSTPYAYTLQGIRRITNAGDCNIDIRKNGVSLAVYSASAAVASAALSASFAVGDNLTVVTTSVSSCSGLSVYAQLTRGL